MRTLRQELSASLWMRVLFGYYRLDTRLREALWSARRGVYVVRNYRNYAKDLNRRAAVEQQLWDCFHGKRTLPDRQQCAEWARKLGIPDEYR